MLSPHTKKKENDEKKKTEQKKLSRILHRMRVCKKASFLVDREIRSLLMKNTTQNMEDKKHMARNKQQGKATTNQQNRFRAYVDGRRALQRLPELRNLVRLLQSPEAATDQKTKTESTIERHDGFDRNTNKCGFLWSRCSATTTVLLYEF